MSKTNDDKIKEYRKSQIKKWVIIVVYLLVIVLEVLALFNKINMLWGCFLFIIVYLFKKLF